MTIVNTKFGQIYIESLNYNNNCPANREEEDRIKVFDSLGRYIDYHSVELLQEYADTMELTMGMAYNEILKTYENAEYINDIFPDGIMFATKSFQEMYIYMLSEDYFDDDIRKEINHAVWKGELTKDFLLTCDWINVIGDYYVLVCEN